MLDAFAGTGALGIEALSRGAAVAAFLESDGAAERLIRANLRALDAEDRATVLRRDVTQPGTAATRVALAMLDPPYGSGLAAPALAALALRGWLGEGAAAVVEIGADETFVPPEGFTRLDERRYGAARLVFLKRTLP